MDVRAQAGAGQHVIGTSADGADREEVGIMVKGIGRRVPGQGHMHILARWRGRMHDRLEIGRASCRERVCQYVSISVVAVASKKKTQRHKKHRTMRLHRVHRYTENKRDISRHKTK